MTDKSRTRAVAPRLHQVVQVLDVARNRKRLVRASTLPRLQHSKPIRNSARTLAPEIKRLLDEEYAG